MSKIIKVEHSFSSLIDRVSSDINTIESLLMHAVAKSRTKADILVDLDKISDLVSDIKKSVCGI